MKYNLDRTVHFATEQEFARLFSWSLQEFTVAGQPVGTKQIPWVWSLYFTGTDITFHRDIEVKSEADGKAAQLKNDEQIKISLAPEAGRRSTWGYATRYSMFGTDRTIKSFTLTVRRSQAEDPPRCMAWGFPSYTTEADESFRGETVEDTLGFELTISEQEFAELRLAAQQGTGDYSITFAVSRVYGFYAESSPGISTDAVKVLAGVAEQTVVVPEGVGPLPCLSIVGEAKLYLARRSALAGSNRTTETEEIAEQEAEPNIEKTTLRAIEQNQGATQILASIGALQKAVARLRLPLWLIFVVSILILMSHAK